MTKNEIITTAKCCIVDNCVSCPLAGHGNCITDFMNHILEYMKTEPAPAATNINSNDKTLQIDDRTLLRIYQEELHNISDTITKTDYGADYILGSIRTTLYIIEKLKGGDGNES